MFPQGANGNRGNPLTIIITLRASAGVPVEVISIALPPAQVIKVDLHCSQNKLNLLCTLPGDFSISMSLSRRA
ncbi:unnamed protein product [Boreogadus saida]